MEGSMRETPLWWDKHWSQSALHHCFHHLSIQHWGLTQLVTEAVADIGMFLLGCPEVQELVEEVEELE